MLFVSEAPISPSMAAFFLLLFLSSIHGSAASLPPLTVQFPFALAKALTQFDRSAYPGFHLTPAAESPILSLPPSGNFSVVEIDYFNQLISLSDPDRCLPNRILTLDLTASPFSAARSLNYTFLNCSEPNLSVPDAVAVTCLSGASFTVYVASSEEAVEKLVSGSGRCRTIKSVLAPIMSLPAEILTRFTPGTAFMELAWNVPECRRCVQYYGFVDDQEFSDCEFKQKSGLEIKCRSDITVEMVLKALIKIVLFSFVVVCVVKVCSTAWDCVESYRKRRVTQEDNSTSN